MSNQLDFIDHDQVIKEAKRARMQFISQNRRLFAYGYSLLGLLCAVGITALAVENANRDQQILISHAAKTTKHP